MAGGQSTCHYTPSRFKSASRVPKSSMRLRGFDAFTSPRTAAAVGPQHSERRNNAGHAARSSHVTVVVCPGERSSANTPPAGPQSEQNEMNDIWSQSRLSDTSVPTNITDSESSCDHIAQDVLAVGVRDLVRKQLPRRKDGRRVFKAHQS